MAYTDSEDLNYLGMLFSVGARSTPFLDAIGNPVTGGNINASMTNSFEFATAVPEDTGAGSQPAITEAASVTGVTATTITRGQDVNTCQIFMKKAEVSYKKLSTTGTVNNALSGVHNIDGAQAGMSFGVQGNQVQNELDHQVQLNLKKMASDIDYSFINGSYQGAASAATAAKTRGLANAITTNAVAAGAATLNQSHVNQTIKAMVDSGAPRINVVALCNSYQRQILGSLYEFAPMDRFVGGVQIQQIYTDFCIISIMYDPNMPTDELYFVDMSVIRFKVCPIQGKVFLVEDKSTDGASYAKQMYGQFGLDYGPEEYHGKITGLATS